MKTLPLTLTLTAALAGPLASFAQANTFSQVPLWSGDINTFVPLAWNQADTEWTSPQTGGVSLQILDQGVLDQGVLDQGVLDQGVSPEASKSVSPPILPRKVSSGLKTTVKTATVLPSLGDSQASTLGSPDLGSPNLSQSLPPLLAQDFNAPTAQTLPNDTPFPAQDVLPDDIDDPRIEDLSPSPQLPSPEELLQSSPDTSPDATDLDTIPGSVRVERYEVIGATVFREAELAAVTQEFTGAEVSFSRLLQARTAVTELYVDEGYINSGAFLPEQTLEDGVVQIQVVEGTLSEINVTGLNRLTPRYVEERVKLAAGNPLNVPNLLEGLRLLQLDPLIETVSAELSAGIHPGQSILDLEVTQSPAMALQLGWDNGRVPSVGTHRRQINAFHGNIFGQGDSLGLGYSNTSGSNSFDLDYQIPLNARNGKFRFFFAHSESQVIEDPFSILEIRSGSNNWDFSFRQPILQTTAQEFSTTIGINNRATETSLEIGDERIGFPLSEGANDNGDTSITVVRFAQEWIRRTPNQVLGLRSQFNFGTNWFGATVNDQATGLPDGEFFTWQGQGQWVRQFAPDTILLVRSNLQMADRPLLSLEQFGVGGANSVRGYRQDRILADNGLFSSIEARIPIFRIPQIDSVAQIAPFIDYGVVWSSGDRPDPDPGQLLSVGLGLRWQFADHINARLDWGFPLMNDEQNNNTLQEQGILFSITADMTR